MKLKELKEKLLKNPKFEEEYFKHDYAMEMGEEIASARISKGWTQERLAKAIKTKQPAIARIENGLSEVSISQMAKIAEALKWEFKPPKILKNTDVVSVDAIQSDTLVSIGNKKIPPTSEWLVFKQ